MSKIDTEDVIIKFTTDTNLDLCADINSTLKL